MQELLITHTQQSLNASSRDDRCEFTHQLYAAKMSVELTDVSVFFAIIQRQRQRTPENDIIG